MKAGIIVRYSRNQILEMKNYDILSMMDEIGINSIPLDILPNGKCRVPGNKTIFHLNWNEQ